MRKRQIYAELIKMLSPKKRIITIPKEGPHFIGIGAHKAATSWLFKMLSMHPDVYFPKGKEVAYWNAKFDKREHIATYLDAFRAGTAAALGGLNGDITPEYMLATEEDIAFLRETLPDVRLLFIARNPVDRAISGADFHVRFRPEQVDDYEDLLFSNFITQYGMYMKHLDNWMNYFPREQLHIIIQDDIKSNPRNIMEGVAEHIGVSPEIWQEIPIKYLLQSSNAAHKKTVVTGDVKERLRDVYRADVKRFSKFVGRDLTHWVE